MALILDGTNTPTLGGVGYGDGTELAFSAAGTSGQVLTSAGGAAPTWATPSLGGMVFLSSVTASGTATAGFTSGFSSTYDDYLIIAENVTFATSSTYLYGRLYKSSVLITTGTYQGQSLTVNNAAPGYAMTTLGAFSPSLGPAANAVGTAQIYIVAANNTSGKTQVSYTWNSNSTVGQPNAENLIVMGAYRETTTNPVTGFILFGSSNISGTFKLYGIAKS